MKEDREPKTTPRSVSRFDFTIGKGQRGGRYYLRWRRRQNVQEIRVHRYVLPLSKRGKAYTIQIPSHDGFRKFIEKLTPSER